MCFWPFKRSAPILPFAPSSTEKIDRTELEKILRPVFSAGSIYLSDIDNYYLCNYDDIALFLAQDQTNKAEYVAQKHDCDDFAYRLMGQFSIPGWSALAFGLFWTTSHAMNCFVNEDREVLFIEPQSDEITSGLSPAKYGHGFRFVIM